MTCDDSPEAIQELVDGALDGARRASLDAHLAGCAACRGLASDLREIRRAARTLEPLATPPSVWPRLTEQLRAPQATPSRSAITGWPSNWRHLAAAALVVVVAGVSLILLLRGGPPAGGPSSDPASMGAGNASPSEVVQSVETELQAAERHYEAALANLERMAEGGDPRVDGQVVKTLRQNVALVDAAIADSRAALQTEPQSLPARESLFEALRRKVGLLQDTITLVNEMRKGNQAGAAQVVEGLKKS
jgi:hypothetical protein